VTKKHMSYRKKYKSGEVTLFPLVAKCKRNMKSKKMFKPKGRST